MMRASTIIHALRQGLLRRGLLASFVLAAGAPMPTSATPTPSAATARVGATSGVWYEIFVRAWYDTDGNGIGDLNGVTAKLDYLQSLGVDGIWLLPIQPSPSYHGYDVTDCEAINPQYGTMADFERLVAAAHQRGIKVILDLVANHTSNQHPWFRAARDSHDPHHDWYQWAGPRTDLRAISATGDLAWHRLGKQAYLGVFTAEMPDLDYDTPAVRKQMIDVGRFWLDKGADGFRLDAAQHIYFDFKSQAGDTAVAAKNVRWWSDFRAGIEPLKPDVYLVGEVTQHTPAALAPYLQPLDAVFNFPLAERLIDSARHQRNRGIDALLDQTAAVYRGTAHAAGDAPFLSNHDQERVMSQLQGNRQHMRMAAALLLTLPGTPYLYYGEELGMRGRKPDPDLREPMRWQRRADAPGESRWKVSSVHQGGEVSVQAEQDDPTSLLNFYRRLIRWRMQVPALRDGTVRSIASSNPHFVAYIREDAASRVLVVHNVSGKPQTFKLEHRLLPVTGVLLQSGRGVVLDRGNLALPAYTTVVLQ